jgi:two-component system sensor histidine kinase ChvG
MEAIERFAAGFSTSSSVSTAERIEVSGLRISCATSAARERLLAILKQDVGRLDRLITDISNASRLDAELSRDPARPVALDRLLREIVSLYETVRRDGEASVRLLVEGADGLTVSGREGPLSQVFRNLIDNARSFSPPGGEVRVTVSRERNMAVIKVDDDGPGMPPENLETVFERFYTSRPKGAAFGGASGLGLSIARQIVAAHGGAIHAENRTDTGGMVTGARFIVAIPASRNAA